MGRRSSAVGTRTRPEAGRFGVRNPFYNEQASRKRMLVRVVVFTLRVVVFTLRSAVRVESVECLQSVV